MRKLLISGVCRDVAKGGLALTFNYSDYLGQICVNVINLVNIIFATAEILQRGSETFYHPFHQSFCSWWGSQCIILALGSWQGF